MIKYLYEKSIYMIGVKMNKIEYIAIKSIVKQVKKLYEIQNKIINIDKINILDDVTKFQYNLEISNMLSENKLLRRNNKELLKIGKEKSIIYNNMSNKDQSMLDEILNNAKIIDDNKEKIESNKTRIATIENILNSEDNINIKVYTKERKLIYNSIIDILDNIIRG